LWSDQVVALAILAAILLLFGGLLWPSRKLEKRGVIKNYSRGLFEVETMLRPSKQCVRQAYFAERIASAIFAACTVAFTSCVRMMCAPFSIRATSLARVP
jgi:hypothetical protein